MTPRRPYCRDRMCGATDCSNCYGPGYDRDDDEPEEDNDPGGLFSDDGDEGCDKPDDAEELPCNP